MHIVQDFYLQQLTRVPYYRVYYFFSRNTGTVTILQSPNENHSTPPIWLSSCQPRSCAGRPHIPHLHIAAYGYKHEVPSFFGKTLAFLAVPFEISTVADTCSVLRIILINFVRKTAVFCDQALGRLLCRCNGRFHACDQLPEVLKK